MIDLNVLEAYIAWTDNLEHLDQLADKLRSMILQIRDRKEVLTEVKYIAQVLQDGEYYAVGTSKYPHKAKKIVEKYLPPSQGFFWANEWHYVHRKDRYGDDPRAKVVTEKVGKVK